MPDGDEKLLLFVLVVSALILVLASQQPVSILPSSKHKLGELEQDTVGDSDEVLDAQEDQGIAASSRLLRTCWGQRTLGRPLRKQRVHHSEYYEKPMNEA